MPRFDEKLLPKMDRLPSAISYEELVRVVGQVIRIKKGSGFGSLDNWHIPRFGKAPSRIPNLARFGSLDEGKNVKLGSDPSFYAAISYRDKPILFPYAQKITVSCEDTLAFIGDVHGDANSLGDILWKLRNLKLINEKFKFKKGFTLLFSGDMIDRGIYGAEVIYTYCLLKINNPNNVFWSRGNHDGATSNFRETNGFFDFELQKKYGLSLDVLLKGPLVELFDILPVAILIKVTGLKKSPKKKNILCCHGGINRLFYIKPFLKDEKSTFYRISNKKVVDGLLWNYFANVSLTDFIYNYGFKTITYLGLMDIKKYIDQNNLALIVGGHQHQRFGVGVLSKKEIKSVSIITMDNARRLSCCKSIVRFGGLVGYLPDFVVTSFGFSGFLLVKLNQNRDNWEIVPYQNEI